MILVEQEVERWDLPRSICIPNLKFLTLPVTNLWIRYDTYSRLIYLWLWLQENDVTHPGWLGSGLVLVLRCNAIVHTVLHVSPF